MPISYLLSYKLSFVTETFLNSVPFFFSPSFITFQLLNPFGHIGTRTLTFDVYLILLSPRFSILNGIFLLEMI